MSLSSSAHQILGIFPNAKRNNSLPPAVSLVLAQSERSSSTTSAADHLTTIPRRAMPPCPPSKAIPILIENHDEHSAPASSPESPPANAVQESTPPALDSIQATPQVVTLSDVDQSSPLPPVSLSSVSASAQDCDPTPSLSNKRSWFNIFSWSGDEKTSIIETKAEIGSPPEVMHSVHACMLPLENNSKLDLHATASLENSDPIARHSNHLTDLPLPENGAPRYTHSASVPSNGDALPICEEQPVSQHPSNPLPHHSPLAGAQAGITPPASNSATSAFPFSFSASLKSRSPPEMVIAEPPRKPCAEPPLKRHATVPGVGNTHNLSVNEIEPSCTAPSSAADISECGNQSLSQPAAATEVRTNVWWTYLGWNAGPAATLPEPSTQRMQSTGAHPSELSEQQPPKPIESSQTEGEGLPRADQTDVIVTERSLPNEKNLPPDHDTDVTRVLQVSTWYSPWSWYQPSSSTSIPVPDTKTAPQEVPPAQMGKKADEDLGAHHTLDQASPSPQESAATGSVDHTNPIQAVISANPTGWMSFFAAKAVAMKSIAYEKEEGEMEVMEIDDEIPPVPNSPPPSASTATQPPPIPVTKPSAWARSHTSDMVPPSFPHSKKTDDKGAPIPLMSGRPESAVNDVLKRQPSPSPSKKSSVKALASPPPPNLVLPTWSDTFHSLPRSAVHREPPSVLSKTLRYVSDVLFSREEAPSNKGKGKGKEPIYSLYDQALPRAWDVINGGQVVGVLKGCKKVVIIGVHGWFPGAVLRTLAGEPTGTSSRFVNGMADALDLFQAEHNVKLDKVTKIPLEGEGTINRRVERLYQDLISNEEWMEDLHNADAIFIAAHSQGSVVSTHLLDRLIIDRHIRTSLNADSSIPASGVASGSVSSVQPPQRICCLALCGVHLGPLRYLSTSSLVQPYIQYFESTAARELFEFQNTESAISRNYVRALRNVLTNGIKMVYIASLTDQVVGLYSGLFTSVSHPLILRALYIDGDAYHPSDFLSNLLVLLLRIRNAGLSDGGLLTHLSEVTAGSLNGIGHSTPYEERATYSLAVNYLFLADSGSRAQVEFVEEPFNALAERNDYEIPWALRDLIADEKVASLFSEEIVALRDAFRDWHPKTTILRDVKRKLQPIQRLSSALISSHTSKL